MGAPPPGLRLCSQALPRVRRPTAGARALNGASAVANGRILGSFRSFAPASFYAAGAFNSHPIRALSRFLVASGLPGLLSFLTAPTPAHPAPHLRRHRPGRDRARLLGARGLFFLCLLWTLTGLRLKPRPPPSFACSATTGVRKPRPVARLRRRQSWRIDDAVLEGGHPERPECADVRRMNKTTWRPSSAG